MTTGEIVQLATELADRLAKDVPLCRTRVEHIRVTARASEARRIADLLAGVVTP
jgi:hypothetical protein